jgi:hypothetical protein
MSQASVSNIPCNRARHVSFTQSSDTNVSSGANNALGIGKQLKKKKKIPKMEFHKVFRFGPASINPYQGFLRTISKDSSPSFFSRKTQNLRAMRGLKWAFLLIAMLFVHDPHSETKPIRKSTLENGYPQFFLEWEALQNVPKIRPQNVPRRVRM